LLGTTGAANQKIAVIDASMQIQKIKKLQNQNQNQKIAVNENST